ncbi:MAG: DUF4368 domain-containing protein [Oscillospiraceae bacterium]|nr:DUF4368 domain-containing protein [Oscillospiraceae bacterium]
MKIVMDSVLREFIDHIAINHAEKMGKERMQKIEIYYNCIDVFEASALRICPGLRLSWICERE